MSTESPETTLPAFDEQWWKEYAESGRHIYHELLHPNGIAYRIAKDAWEESASRRASVGADAAGESPILAFEKWAENWCATLERKFTPAEYFVAQAAFYAAHPGEGPSSATMATSPSDAAAITRAFMEETFGPAAESDDIDSRMEKYGVAFAAIQYALATSPSDAADICAASPVGP